MKLEANIFTDFTFFVSDGQEPKELQYAEGPQLA